MCPNFAEPKQRYSCAVNTHFISGDNVRQSSSIWQIFSDVIDKREGQIHTGLMMDIRIRYEIARLLLTREQKP